MKYTVDVRLKSNETLKHIKIRQPIRWDEFGIPTHFEYVSIPFCITGKRKYGNHILYRARILTMDSFN